MSKKISSKKKNKAKPQNNKSKGIFIRLLLVIILALIIYSNTLNASWHFDDSTSIRYNYKIKNVWVCLKDIVSNPRSICDISFALNYYYSGDDVYWYHVTNIIIHIISSILIYFLIRLTVHSMKQDGRLSYNINFLPLTGSLLFAVHPIQTQAVTYIVQRYTSLATMFYLTALVFFIWARMSQIYKGSRFFSASHLPFYLFSIVSALLAMRTKEIAVTIPFIFLLYDFTFLKRDKKELKKAFIYILPFFILFVVQIVSRVIISGSDIAAFGEVIDRSLRDTARIGRVEYALTSLNVVLTYIRLLFFPVNQNIYYVYPVSSSIFSNYTYVSLIAHMLILVLAALMFRVSRLVSFGIFWFYITVSVESSIIPIRDVIFEHRVYLPSVGFVMFITGLVLLAGKRKRMFYCLTTIAVVMLSVLTYNRNSVWKDDLTLWSSSLQVNKNNPITYMHLGNYFLEKKLYDKSIEKYKMALMIYPDFAEVHSNLGYTYEQKGLLDIAVNEYRKAYIAEPNYAEAHINLGNLYKKKGLFDKAINEYAEALRIRPRYAEVFINMGNAYKEKGRYDLSEIEYKKALNIKPDYPRGYYALGNLYAEKKAWNESIDCYNKAISLDKNFSEAYNKLGSLYSDIGEFDKAISVFEKVIKINPHNTVAYNNLAIIYAQKGRFDDAIIILKKLLNTDPYLLDVRFNLGLAYYSKGERKLAIDEFRKVLKMNPNYVKAKNKLALLEEKTTE